MKIQKKCLQCHTVFWVSPCREKTAKYCSPSCGMKYRRSLGKYDNQKTSKIVDCAYCGRKIKKNLSRIKESQNVFCSRSCNALFYSQKKPPMKTGIMTCIVCGKKKEMIAIHARRAITCSQRCRGLHIIRNNPKKQTSIEKAIQSVLDSIGIEYFQQETIKGK